MATQQEKDMQLLSAQIASRPVRILVSAQCAARNATRIGAQMGSLSYVLVVPDVAGADLDAEVAFLSRDLTGLSTKDQILPATQTFYDAMCRCRSLSWVHNHSAGADRPILKLLRERGVVVTTSSGANASVVAQSALAGILSLARRFPMLAQAQREREWAPLIKSGLPRDIDGQTAVVVGWGPIGQKIGALLTALGMRVIAVRQSVQASPPAVATLTYDALRGQLPHTDWLVLACPLSDTTHGLVSADVFALLPTGSHLVNVSRGEIVDETALCAALAEGRLAGAYLDVFVHEPLPKDSLLWSFPNVILTPHSAGVSDANGEQIMRMFLANLLRWVRGEALINVSR
jgi:phosphoglycerate dehydrogenase-like enzyme